MRAPNPASLDPAAPQAPGPESRPFAPGDCVRYTITVIAGDQADIDFGPAAGRRRRPLALLEHAEVASDAASIPASSDGGDARTAAGAEPRPWHKTPESAVGIETGATPLDIARDYINRGWNPVPIGYRQKGPTSEGWQRHIIDASNAPRYFAAARMNVGVILGTSSRGLTDIDLDCDEALAIAPYILPKTGAIFGRTSRRAAHRLHYTSLADSAETAVLNFNDPQTKSRMIELRIGGGKGAQTVFPGSTHKETGEPTAWDESGEPASVDGEDLRRAMFGREDRAAERGSAESPPLPHFPPLPPATRFPVECLGRILSNAALVFILVIARATFTSCSAWPRRLERIS